MMPIIMSGKFLKYRGLLVDILSLVLLCLQVALTQTSGNTTITSQAKAIYKYKTFPADTVPSVPVVFTILAAPNFEFSFGARDTNVFSKETLLVRFVYKNVGNVKADSATIETVLPPAGLRFVPGSTQGTISNGTVTWKILNVNPGQTDSVSVKMVVDSTLNAGIQLSVDASLTWLSSSVTASKIFVVHSFPRLEMTNVPSASVVGSGRTITYQITVKNTGNVQSTNTTLVDTISQNGTYQSASVTPDSIRSAQRVIVWKMGTIPASSQKVVSVTVVTQSNIGEQTLSNTAVAYSDNVPAGAESKVVVPIIPVAPKSISISIDRQYIFGKLNQDSARIQVVLRDSNNQALPDGVPVQLTTSLGFFSNNLKTTTVILQNETASAMLRSENVQNIIERATIVVLGGTSLAGTIKDSAYVFMYPGAVTGMVVNGIDRQPLQGAIALVFNSSEQIAGSDTTGSDGWFFIPLNKDIKLYTLKIVVQDRFGDTITTQATVDPTIFPAPPIVIPNTLSGRIVYKISGRPVPAEGVTVFLDSAASGVGLSVRNQRQVKGLLPSSFGFLSRVREEKTDQWGRFKFENLKPSQYVISVDSNQYPSYKGYNFISDTVAGTLTINFTIEISQDSTVSLVMTRYQENQTVNAGDTVQFTIAANNMGNVTHYNVALTDTLPRFTHFVSAEKGIFKSVEYDTTNRIVRWSADSLRNSEGDSVHLRLLLSRNIPDSTNMRNAVWFSSTILSGLNSVTNTVIRSAAELKFGNLFGKDSTMAGDSLQKIIWFSNTGTDSVKGIRIVDTMYSAGKVLARVDTNYSSVISDSIITIFIGAIAPGESDTVTISMQTDFSLKKGTTIISSAHLMQNDSSLLNVKAELRMSDNPKIASFLKIIKSANKKIAEIGDIVTYQIQISNTSPTYVYPVRVFDFLPYAFKYIKNSARFNGKPVEPRLDQNFNSLNWDSLETILSNRTGTLVYQLAIGADGLESEGLNTAYASATASNGTILTSAASQWQVTVRPGVFTEKGLIIGKVFYDDNRNAYQESGENGIKDVELWMEDGTKIVTGDDGKYSLPEVKPGQHVLRINEHSLPSGVELLGGNNKFANDPSSQFVRVTEGGIAKANFFVKRNLQDSISQTVGKVNNLLAARQAKPKYLYSDTLYNITIDTVDMFVSFTFSCNKYLQSIEVNETLPPEFTIVQGSGVYNGRKINPAVLGSNVQWKIGRAQDYVQGVLKYKVALKKIGEENTILLSTASIKGITADSTVIESQKLITENIIRNERKNKIETSYVASKSMNPNHLAESVTAAAGDEIFFKTFLYIDPKKKIKSVRLIDSLQSELSINERSFAVNGVPLSSGNLSVRVRSSSFSSRSVLEKNEIEFLRISTVDLTELIRQGVNEITYTARLSNDVQDTMYRKTTYALVTNEFSEETLLRSKELKINISSAVKPLTIVLETSLADILRPIVSIETKVAEAVRLVESLNSGTSNAVVMESITFEPGKSVLTNDAIIVLNTIAKILNEYPQLKIQINGHTDNTGNANANRKVSLARAEVVRSYLMKQGIEPARLFAQGFGPDKPIASNKTEEGRTKNRRVEFVRRK